MIKPLMVIAIILGLVLFVSEAFMGQFFSLRLIGTKGNIQSPPNIGIYWDSNRTTTASFIDWGSMQTGLTKNVTIYIANEGNEKVHVSLNTANWKPANISRYMNLTWSYNGATINPDETIQITLTLSTSSSPDFINYLIANDPKNFSFDIIINAFS